MSKLYIVPTPIGNLEDMTFRAINILKSCNLILAEDTRTSSKLLRHFEIDTHMVSHHKFNEHKASAHIVDRIEGGETIALISDAGTPAISDPGFFLVRECIERQVEVECLPGATAFVPALVNSGFSTDRFCFEGFLPQKKGRMKKIESLLEEDRTIIFYESPYRLIKALTQFSDVYGPDRRVCVCRELSKMFNESVRGTLEEVKKHFEEKGVKGEIVIVIEGCAKKK